MSFSPINPREYDVTESRGFLPPYRDPARHLPSSFAKFEEAVDSMPDHLMRHNWGDVLPGVFIPHDVSALSHRELLLFHSKGAFAMHGFMWEDHMDDVVHTRIPKNLSVPFVAAAKKLGLPPSLVYMVYASCNWYRKDPTGPIVYDNVDLITGFTRDQNERGFIVPHIKIEELAGRAVYAAIRTQEMALCEQLSECGRQLQKFLKAYRKMNEMLIFLGVVCKPGRYFDIVRPYLHGPKHELTKGGVVFEGVSEEKVSVPGETGAQSSTLPLFDRAMGVTHNPKNILSMHLQEMLMVCTPPAHRALVLEVGRRPPICSLILKHKSLVPLYNDCIREMIRFRKQHLAYAMAYIYAQERKRGGLANPSKMGTGNTNFKDSLELHIADTERALIL